MNGNNILVDTNIIIDIFEGNKDYADKLNQYPKFSISVTVLGELYIGVNRVTNKAKQEKKLNEFIQKCSILNVDSLTAKIYGDIVAALYRKGKPIPSNDIWIAATALQYDLLLISNDKHFDEIDGLRHESW